MALFSGQISLHFQRRIFILLIIEVTEVKNRPPGFVVRVELPSSNRILLQHPKSGDCTRPRHWKCRTKPAGV